MDTPTIEVRKSLNEILTSRKDVVHLASQQRAKFEGWLKFELAAALCNKGEFSNVTLEDGYLTQGRSDISFEHNGAKWFVEMKTANTNWRAAGVEKLTRPITRNIRGIVEDIMVLREKCAPAHGLAVFCIFPVPDFLWKNTRQKLNNHLRRIENEGGLPENSVVEGAEFIELTSNYGICTFALEIL